MSDEYEAELKLALEKGFISEAEVDALRQDALRLGRSPLQLLVDRGLVSEKTLVSARKDHLHTPAVGRQSPSGPVTLQPDSGKSIIPSPSASFPVPGWDRYQFMELLGEGGMGQVFLAYDPRLHRNVALKFVRGRDTEFVQRLISEARAQARVQHERVCPVHEVGEVDGLPYIAMHHVKGQPLSHFVGRLTVRQKAELLRDAAQGIHAAHAVGLIHRDIKPSNILVEQGEDGRLQPYVMDFGLARDWHAKGATETGSIVGTPHYMSPEQARGEGERLDWRSDVYSLGATLYHLLTGQLPIPGENGLKVLNNIATVEPRPPRQLDPRIPKDLEAIVLKCLEKDRSARYDSVLALIEDLDRFLKHEPVKARSTALGYRLYKKARKHQRLVTVAAVALLAVAGALGWALYRSRMADRQAELARRFTEKIERIESMARLSALAPLHDTRKSRAALRQRLDALELEIQDAGTLAAGPGHYALGRGYLALGEDDKAREQLEAAWNEGFREPRVASALALALSRQYRKQRLEAARASLMQRSGGPSVQEGRGSPPGLDQQRLEKLYREPALEYLRRSQGAEELSPAWVGALLAFYDDKLDEALARLDTMDAPDPWSHEALQLRGDILRVRASRRVGEGDFTGARKDFDAGRKAYAAAAEIGRSEPAIHLAQADLELSELIMELYSSGQTQEPFSRGLEAVARARVAAPDSAEALLLAAQLHRRVAEHKLPQGNTAEAQTLLQKARELAEEALRLQPTSSQARVELGQQLIIEARRLSQLREDPRQQLRQALMHFERVGPEDRNAAFEVHTGQLFDAWADYEIKNKGAPLPYLAKAIEAYHQATLRDGTLRAAWLNMGRTYLNRESLAECQDPEGDLKKAQDALAHAQALGPDHVRTYYYSAIAHEREAVRSRGRGADARADLREAQAQYEHALAIDDKASYVHDRLGLVLQELAREEEWRGDDPFRLLDQAEAHHERAFALAPRVFTARINVSDVQIQRALFQRARGMSSEASLRSASSTLDSVREPLEHDPQLWANLGTVYVLMAGLELEQGRDASRSLSRAEEMLDKALRLEKDLAQAWLYRGQLRELQARWRARQALGKSQGEDFTRAADEFQEAIRLAAASHDPREMDYRLALGQLCCEWAAGRRGAGDGRQQAQRLGLEQVKTVMDVRPAMPDVLKLRDCLQCTDTASCP